MKRDYFLVFASIAWAVFLIVGVVIINNSLEVRVKKETEKAYQQGRKDALYKRPVSEELDMVCAGLWIGQENLKYQQREMKK